LLTLPEGERLCFQGRADSQPGGISLGQRTIAGQDLRGAGTLDAPGYRRTFCTLCGGPVPTVDKDTINIPAGTLNDDPGLRPQRHIFVDRKAPWFDIDGRLPRYPTK
jgi:hypothetical protein